jgi:hypothetical protein
MSALELNFFFLCSPQRQCVLALVELNLMTLHECDVLLHIHAEAGRR